MQRENSLDEKMLLRKIHSWVRGIPRQLALTVNNPSPLFVENLLSVTCFLVADDIKQHAAHFWPYFARRSGSLPERSCASPSGISHLGLSRFSRIFVQGTLPTWKGILSERLHELCNGRVDLQVLLKLIRYRIKKRDETGFFIQQRGRKKKSEFRESV